MQSQELGLHRHTSLLKTAPPAPAATVHYTPGTDHADWDLDSLQRFVESIDERADILHLVELRADHDLVAARETVRLLGSIAGMAPSEMTCLLTVASELGRNALVHAGGGALAIGVTAPQRHVVLGALDHGPGIPQIDLALKDGYSTIRGLGMGLPGSKRLMDRFQVLTATGHGTVVVAAKLRRE